MRVTLVIASALSFAHPCTAFGASEKGCAQLQKEYTHVYEWDLAKVHKVFGQPARIDRGVYEAYAGAKFDVLTFNSGGCYFQVYIDGHGQAGQIPNGFHYRPSELLGKSTPIEAPQPNQFDAVYASMQALESRIKTLEAAIVKLGSTVGALQSASASAGSATSVPRTASAPRSTVVPSSTEPTNYTAVGSGHWVNEVSGNGRIIELEDGSLWEIEATDQIDTALWLPVTDISVQQISSPIGAYKYVLVNKEDGEKASAKFLGMG